MSAEDELFGGEERATPLTQPYWDALHEGRLVLQRCDRCGRRQHYPRRLCRYCSSEDLSFAAASGAGRIFASTVVHRANTPAMKARVPYVLALVRTDEGPLVFALLEPAGDPAQPLADAVVQVDPDRTRKHRLLTVRVGGASHRPPRGPTAKELP